MTTFATAVRKAVQKIPRGGVRTYSQIAAAAGFPRAARAVGSVLAHNFDTAVPCHRVIRSDGGVGNYNRGIALKITKLLSEGINIKNGKVIQ